MKKNVLIIRSVSFQQLDKNIIRIKEAEAFAGPDSIDWAFYLLTHSHGTNRARKYETLSGIFDYRSRKNFSFFHIPKKLAKEKFHAVIVPVTNKTGAGFLNVFLMTLRLKTKKIYCCNLVSDIWEIPRLKIIFQLFRSMLFSLVSLVLTFISLLLLPFLVFPSLLMGKSE